jgi:7,8-dihydropterin-6-yl-methyl-4-(beta-D-ribofuranosyl)aminobenzene 5'-phosphate synthase
MGVVERARLWWRSVSSVSVVLLLTALVGACRAASPEAVTLVPTLEDREIPTDVPTLAVTPSPPPLVTKTVAPTPTALPPSPTSSPMPTPALDAEVRPVTFTIVYDNNPYDGIEAKSLRTSWGFACWITTEERTVLFDTGGDGATLLHNLREMDLDPLAVDAVVLSHAHGDHTGGLSALLDTGSRPTVYVPASFSRAFKEGVRGQTDLVEVTAPMTVAPGIHTTGEMGTGIVEQALAVETEEGLVVVTGCAHPGVDSMVRRAHDHLDGQIALVMGGFHLGGASRRRVEGIVTDFRELGVQSVAPCHCTGDAARRLFHEAFGGDCVLAGVGWSTTFALDTKE